MSCPPRYRLSFLLILLVGTIALPAVAEDWPTFRHDRQRTASTDEKLSLPLQQVWIFRPRQFKYAPRLKGDLSTEVTPAQNRFNLSLSAAGGSLFFSSRADGRLVCLDAATGKKRWEFIAGAAVNHTPTIFDGRAYVGSDDGHAYCLDAKTGDLVWKHKAAPVDRWFFSYEKLSSAWPVRSDVMVAPSASSPRASGAVAYLGAGVFPHDGTFLFALDAHTGKRIWCNDAFCETLSRWSLSPNGHFYATARNLYVPMDFKSFRFRTFLAFSRADGKYVPWGGSDVKTLGNKYGVSFSPLMGAVKGGVSFRGNEAWKGPNRLWSVKTEGYQTDIHSIQGLDVVRGAVVRYDPDLCSVIYAGGTIFHVAFAPDGDAGARGIVYARDAKDGKETWSARFSGWPNQVIAANGRLFVATRGGQILCFAPKQSPRHGVIEEPIDPDPFKGQESLAKVAEALVTKSGIRQGYALVLDCVSGALAYELAKRTELQVCAVFEDSAKADAARKAYARANVHVSRILVWHRKAGAGLPFPSRFADIVVSESASLGGRLPTDMAEPNRLLKPLRGRMFIGGKGPADKLKAWAANVAPKGDWRIIHEGGFSWISRIAPRLKDAGSWTHGKGDAGNSMCSQDGVLKPPLGVVWYGRPYSSRGSKGISPPIISDGVLVCQYQDYFRKDITFTEGYDQYTGRQLWRREKSLTDTVAAPGSIFQRYLEVIVRLDPWTGKVLAQYLPPGKDAKWDKMAASEDGETLYCLSAGRIFPLDVETGKPRWSSDKWGNWSAISDGRIYYLGPKADGDMRAKCIAQMRACLKKQSKELLDEFESQLAKRDIRVLTAVEGKTGRKLFAVGVDISNAGGAWLRPARFGTSARDKENPFVFGEVQAHAGVVLFGTRAFGADKYWKVWPGGGYKMRALGAYDGATGELLWYRFANFRCGPAMTDDLVIAEPYAFDLRTGRPKMRTHPITGLKARWVFCRYDKQCGIFNASRYFVFGRSRGIGYHDLLTDQGLYTFMHSRPTCGIDTSSGGGMMIKPPHAISCKCEVSMPFTIAMAQVPTQPAVPQVFAQDGPSLPVRHLYLDFGATGDRRDAKGNLWLRPERPASHFLLLALKVDQTSYPSGGVVRRSGVFTPIDKTDQDFVFATAARGLKHCVIPVTTPKHGKGIFAVLLGFSALPGDEPGKRVFAVKLNGKTVLKDFDIIREAGKPDTAVWKEFTLTIDRDLTIEMVAKTDKPAVDQMPLLNGVVVLRKE